MPPQAGLDWQALTQIGDVSHFALTDWLQVLLYDKLLVKQEKLLEKRNIALELHYRGKPIHLRIDHNLR